MYRHAYRVAGLVVSKVPQLTYSKTDSRCLLPRLVDWLILPLISSRKPQPQGTAPAIRNNLHLVRATPSSNIIPLLPSLPLSLWPQFLSGLLQLKPGRDDFIRRKVKEIFSRYFQQYNQPNTPLISSSHNPFMVCSYHFIL